MRYVKSGLLVLFALLPLLLSAQPELLKNSLHLNRKDTQTVNLLNRISEGYMAETATDSALAYAAMAAALAEKIHYATGLADAISGQSKNYYKKGDYGKATECAFQSLKICDSVNYEYGKAINYNMLGLVYLSQGKRAASEEQFRRALAINVRLNNKLKMTSNYFNLALLYAEVNNLDSTLMYLHKAEVLSRETQNYSLLVMIENRLGDVYMDGGDLEKAIESYKYVLADSAQGIDWERSYANTSLAICLLKLGKAAEAVKYGEEGVSLAKKLKTKWDIGRGLGVLHEAYAQMGKYEIAYKLLQEQKACTDSLLSEEKEREINVLHLQQEKAERLELQRQNETEQHKNVVNRMVMAAVGLVAVFLMVLVFVIYRNSRKKNALNELLLRKTEDVEQQKALIETQNRELAEINRTKDQLFSIIGHDLRSPFASISSGLDLVRNGYLDEKEQKYLFDKLYEQTTATSVMLDNLLVWAKSQISGIVVRPVKVNVPELVVQLSGVLGSIAADKGINLKHEISEGLCVVADPDHLKIVMQNLLTNAIKFTGNGGTVTVSYLYDNEQVAIRVCDTGEGMDADKVAALFHKTGKDISTQGTNQEKGTGLGLVMVKKFVEENKGEVKVSSTPGKGTEFTILLPIAK